MSKAVSVLRGDVLYPTGFNDLSDPPQEFNILGEVNLDTRPVLAVIGSRQSSVQAELWMRKNLRILTQHCLIVSGGARGIDQTAHFIALEEKQPTVVVLPSGLDAPYPKDWSAWSGRVTQFHGALVSEYPMNETIKSWHFEKRNRLIAALADVVLVVEARSRSGTAITVRHALNMGRQVAALPWFPGDCRGEYCNELLISGASLVRNAEDVADLLIKETRMRLRSVEARLTIPHASKHPDSRN